MNRKIRRSMGQGLKLLSVLLCFSCSLLISDYLFFNSLMIHDEKTKKITTVKEVLKCDLNYHKIW